MLNKNKHIMDVGKFVADAVAILVGEFGCNETFTEFTGRKIKAAEKMIEVLDEFSDNTMIQAAKTMLRVNIRTWKRSLN